MLKRWRVSKNLFFSFCHFSKSTSTSAKDFFRKKSRKLAKELMFTFLENVFLKIERMYLVVDISIIKFNSVGKNLTFLVMWSWYLWTKKLHIGSSLRFTENCCHFSHYWPIYFSIISKCSYVLQQTKPGIALEQALYLYLLMMGAPSGSEKCNLFVWE